MLNERQRAAEIARSRDRVQQLRSDLPSLIEDRVGEQMEKLETKLLSDFRVMGQRAIEEGTAVLNEQLSDRIESLEKVSAMQSKTIVNLRDSSKVADEKVSAVVDEIEKSLAGAVPGFKLDPPAYPQPNGYAQLPDSSTDMVRADSREMSETSGKLGFCPSCTSTDVRRANRAGLFEEFLRLFFIAPFRCRACRHKFYRF